MNVLPYCLPDNRRVQRPKNCIFAGIGPCRDHVSEWICNGHADTFGLIYKQANFHDGENESVTRIVTYVSSSSSLNIPLFVDLSDKIMLNEIHAFAMQVASTHDIDGMEYEKRIACLMGMNPYGSNESCNMGSWLDDKSAYLVVRCRNDDVKFYNKLPQLHRILLNYTTPSNIYNPVTQSYTYYIPNVSLTCNEITNVYQLVVPHKKMLLKYTDHVDCMASPLVLDAYTVSSFQQKDRSFRPLMTNYRC